MKILIVGAKGMLGQELARVFVDNDLVLWDREDIDITNKPIVDDLLQELRPELIINAAAYNSVDEAEEKFELAKRVNYHGPVNLAKAAQELGAIFVHYTTDYVFDGQKESGYLEHDLPAPISRYGESKYLGEEVLEHNDLTYIIRTSRLFGQPATSMAAKKSFVELMLDLAEKKDELEVVDEEYGCPTYVVDLAVQTKLLVEGDYNPGIYHCVNEGACTWRQFAEEIFNQANVDVKVKPVPSSRFPRPAKRPVRSRLINSKLPAMRTWEEALKDYLTEIGRYNMVSEVFIPEPTKKVDLAESQVEIKPQEDKDETKQELTIPQIPISNKNLKVQVKNFPPSKEKFVKVNNNTMTKRKMKGIILSGGKGTRLYPLTKITSKQLLPIYDKAMVIFPLETMVNAGIKDILVIIAPEYAGQYMQLLGSGKDWGVNISYEIQDKPSGLPEAYVIGKNFIGDDNVTMILGDNIFFDHDFTEDIKSFESGGRIFAVEVSDPERFGVVEFDENKKVVSIEEKPKDPKSNFAIPGIYIFDNRVCDIAKEIKPTWRPETDITEVHKAFLDMNELDVRLVNGRWLDAGTHESLLKAANWAAMQKYSDNIGFENGENS